MLLCLFAAAVPASLTAQDIEAHFTGDLAQLKTPEKEVSVAEHAITDADGTVHTLGDKAGKVLLINLWAKWCLPCKEEMPDLVELQRAFGEDRLEVIALPMKATSVNANRKVLRKWQAGELTPYAHDPQDLARLLYRQGLFKDTQVQFSFPTTYIVDTRGRLVAIQEGFRHWNTPAMHALLQTLMAEEQPAKTTGP